MASLEQEIAQLEKKIQDLKLAYGQYFGGREFREPSALRSEVKRQLAAFKTSRITNTAIRFRVNALQARYQTFSRQWDRILREMEDGTDNRQRFKLRQQGRGGATRTRKT